MIEVINRQKTFRIDLERFERLLKTMVRRYGLPKSGLALAFVDDRDMKKLNREFRKKDSVTDVLSFPCREKGPDGIFYLGDIIIAVPRAHAQALELGHSLHRELEILAVHGFLHLLGFEHERGHEEEEKKIHELLLKD